MQLELVEFWKKFKPESAPFVHPDDLETLKYNDCLPCGDEPEPFDLKSYLASSRFGEPIDNRFHLSLLPVPYVGNVAKADIVVLLLNPGFQHSSYWAETAVPGFRDRLRRNLDQVFNAEETPFFCRDPQYCWYEGFRWWEKKLRPVIAQIAQKDFGGRYREAMLHLSQRLACIELIPYQSSSFGDHKLIKDLPSARLAREFVSRHLLGSPDQSSKTVIVTRQVKGWSLHGYKNTSDLIIYEGSETRGASLGPNSRGGRAILSRYDIKPPTSIDLVAN